MTIRPEDHGGTTDPLAPLANLSTRAGHGAGKAIDPTRPSAADLIPTPPGPTADRIAELEREIAHVESGFIGPANLERLTLMRAELSRLRNPELNERGEPMDHATIARGRKPTDAENAPATCPTCGASADVSQITGELLSTEAQSRGQLTIEPATSPGPQDVRIVAILAKELPTIQIEKAEAIVAALLSAFPAIAQSDAQPVGDVQDALQIAHGALVIIAETEKWADGYSPGDLRGYARKVADDVGEPLYTTPPSLPEGAREALERAIDDLPHTTTKVEVRRVIREALATPSPSSADGGGELQQDADRWRAFFNGIPRNSDSKRLLIEFADSLRARAADRSAPRSDKGEA